MVLLRINTEQQPLELSPYVRRLKHSSLVLIFSMKITTNIPGSAFTSTLKVLLSCSHQRLATNLLSKKSDRFDEKLDM